MMPELDFEAPQIGVLGVALGYLNSLGTTITLWSACESGGLHQPNYGAANLTASCSFCSGSPASGTVGASSPGADTVNAAAAARLPSRRMLMQQLEEAQLATSMILEQLQHTA
jgi:hypothetical protein